MPQDHRVLRFYALINGEAEGLARWRASVHPAWVARPGFPEVPDQVTGYPHAIGALRRGIPDLRFDLGEVIERDGFVAVRSTVTGIHSGDLFGAAPTGRAIEFAAIDIHHVVDELIVETWHVEDFARMLRSVR